MTAPGSRARNGVTIPEMLVALVLVGVIGVGITKLIISQTQFFDHLAASRNARNVSRSSLNRIISDIRMVEATQGVVSASASTIVLRVPYAMGVSCTSSLLALMPVDSTLFAQGISGYAWRDSLGVMTYQEVGVSVSNNGSVTLCTNAGITVPTADGGNAVVLAPTLPVSAPVGTAVLLYRKIQYQFKGSAAVAGMTGLYRKDLSGGGVEEELAAPFDTSAKFRFFVGYTQPAVSAAPANLATLRGFELNLNGQSERSVSKLSSTQKEPSVTAVFFRNRVN